MWKLTLAGTILTIVISYEKAFCTTATFPTDDSSTTNKEMNTVSTALRSPVESITTATSFETSSSPKTESSTTAPTKLTTISPTMTTSENSYTSSHSTSTVVISQSTTINTSQLSTDSITTNNDDYSEQSSSESSKTTTREYSRSSSSEQITVISLEEKQKRNGITSAVICVGSLILIGIAYLSSFVDRPTEKVPQTVRDQINQKSRYKYDSEGRIIRQNNNEVNHAGGKKISFGEASQISGEGRPGTSNDIEMTPVKQTMYNAHTDKQTANVSEENRKRGKGKGQSGWDILANNPKFFDDYQPLHTKTNDIEND